MVAGRLLREWPAARQERKQLEYDSLEKKKERSSTGKPSLADSRICFNRMWLRNEVGKSQDNGYFIYI